MLDSLDKKKIDEDNEKRDKNQRRGGFKYSNTVPEKFRRGISLESNYVRYLIPHNLPLNCTDFIYQVNFEPGEGQNSTGVSNFSAKSLRRRFVM